MSNDEGGGKVASISIYFCDLNGITDPLEWEFEAFDPKDANWKIVHGYLDQMGAMVVNSLTEREVNLDAMPRLLRVVMEELSSHESPTPQHANKPDDEGVWEIDYLVGGLLLTVWYWPEGFE